MTASSKRLRLAVVLVAAIATPMTALGLQDRDDGVLTVGEIVRISADERSFTLESTRVGTLRSRPGRPANGEVDIGFDPLPVPGVRVPNVPRPVDRRVSIDPGGPLENRSIEGRPVREGYRGFRVTTDSETEIRQEGQPIELDSLEVGDRVAVLGRIIGEEITAYRVDRSPPSEEERN